MRFIVSQTTVRRRLAVVGLIVCAVLSGARAVPPVSLSFPVGIDEREPFSRELWADVVLPSQKVVRLPAFYSEGRYFTVRARAEEAGIYELGKVTERFGAKEIEIPVAVAEPIRARVDARASRSPIRIDGHAPGKFVFADGAPYVPIGMNLAWAPQDSADWYRNALRMFAAEHLNWTRIWMAHWDGLNLDWLPENQSSVTPGRLNAEVAKKWDELIADAEDNGVYLQLVLQHHGQYSSKVNPNWSQNPWNARNPGGFLHSPTEFFTSAKAMRLTKQKYRYVVARWGYSPAVLAWELFNEVHWVDAIRIDRNEAAVAKWHDEMAAFIRSVDVYDHLITTSTEDLSSPIYQSMDYLQPHLYATAMLAAVRRFDVLPDTLKRPVFYGEMGNDHMRVTAEQKAAAVELVPIVWASVMGQGRYPAQIWEGDKILAQGRSGELGALARFLTATKLRERNDLEQFSPVVQTTTSVPLVIEGAENWHKRPPPDVNVAMDGRQLTEYGTIPRILVGARRSIAEGYPDRIALHVNYPTSATATLRIADAGGKGAKVRVQLDGRTVAEHVWPALAKPTDGEAPARPSRLSFGVPGGRHLIAIENVGRADWIDFDGLDLGLETSSLAGVGQRGIDFIVVWLWQRNKVFAVDSPLPILGTVVIENVHAGRWKAVWWDSVKGLPAAPIELDHPGGKLELATPPVGRHAALMLTQ